MKVPSLKIPNPIEWFRNFTTKRDATINLAWVIVLWLCFLATRWWTTTKIEEVHTRQVITQRKEPIQIPYSKTTSGRVLSVAPIPGTQPRQIQIILEDNTLPKEPDGTFPKITMNLPETSNTARVEVNRYYDIVLETNVRSIDPGAGGERLPGASPAAKASAAPGKAPSAPGPSPAAVSATPIILRETAAPPTTPAPKETAPAGILPPSPASSPVKP